MKSLKITIRSSIKYSECRSSLIHPYFHIFELILFSACANSQHLIIRSVKYVFVDVPSCRAMSPLPMRDHPIFLIRALDGEPQPCEIVQSMFSQPDSSILHSPSFVSSSRTLGGDLSSFGLRSFGRSGRTTDVMPENPSGDLGGSTIADFDRFAGHLEATLPFRPVLLTQRFDDIQIALLCQRIEHDTFGSLLNELQSQFQPEINNITAQLEAMAAGLRTVSRTPDGDDGASELMELFCERLSLMQESAEVEHEYQEAYELEHKLRDGNARLVERLNVDEAGEFLDLVGHLQRAIDAARAALEHLQSRGGQHDMHSAFIRHDHGHLISRSDLACRSVTMRPSMPFLPPEDEANEATDDSKEVPGSLPQVTSLTDVFKIE
jgi:hypothetical protein